MALPDAVMPRLMGGKMRAVFGLTAITIATGDAMPQGLDATRE
jgi:hypothetical protein